MATRLGLTSAAPEDASRLDRPDSTWSNGPERRPRCINILLKPNPSHHTNIGVRRYQKYDSAPCKQAHQTMVTFPINTLSFIAEGEGDKHPLTTIN